MYKHTPVMVSEHEIMQTLTISVPPAEKLRDLKTLDPFIFSLQ